MPLTDQELTPTPTSEWGAPKLAADQGLILELPSGNVCRIRRTMDMLTMLQAGKIPNPLARILNQMIETGDSNISKIAQETEDPEVTRQFFNFLNDTVARAFVEPEVDQPDPRDVDEDWDAYMERISKWKPKKGKLSVFDVELQDKMYVLAVAQGAAADLERFRKEQESIMGTVQAGKRVVKPTKRTGGNQSKK